jgi:hypothetical protein
MITNNKFIQNVGFTLDVTDPTLITGISALTVPFDYYNDDSATYNPEPITCTILDAPLPGKIIHRNMLELSRGIIDHEVRVNNIEGLRSQITSGAILGFVPYNGLTDPVTPGGNAYGGKPYQAVETSSSNNTITFPKNYTSTSRSMKIAIDNAIVYSPNGSVNVSATNANITEITLNGNYASITTLVAALNAGLTSNDGNNFSVTGSSSVTNVAWAVGSTFGVIIDKGATVSVPISGSYASTGAIATALNSALTAVGLNNKVVASVYNTSYIKITGVNTRLTGCSSFQLVSGVNTVLSDLFLSTSTQAYDFSTFFQFQEITSGTFQPWVDLVGLSYGFKFVLFGGANDIFAPDPGMCIPQIAVNTISTVCYHTKRPDSSIHTLDLNYAGNFYAAKLYATNNAYVGGTFSVTGASTFLTAIDASTVLGNFANLTLHGTATTSTIVNDTGVTTANVHDTVATTLNFAGAATALTIGANASGTCTIRNATTSISGVLTSAGNITATNGYVISGAATSYLFNTTATTIYFGAAASTSITIGHASGFALFNGHVKIAGTTATAGYFYAGTGTAPTSTNDYLNFNGYLRATSIYAYTLVGGAAAVYVDASGYLTRSAPSDIRVKENIKAITYGLKELNQLTPIRFTYKDVNKWGDRYWLGLSAQETLSIIPEVIGYDKDEKMGTIMSLDYTELIPVLINAVKELNKEVEHLKQQAVILKNMG